MFTNSYRRINLLTALALLILALALGVSLGANGAWAGTTVTGSGTPGTITQSSESKITSGLRQKFGSNPNSAVRYLVMLVQQTDTSNKLTGKTAKAQYVYDTLKRMAASTQPPVAAFLANQQRAGNVAAFESYYIINAFQVRGNLASAQAVATLPEVASVDEFPVITLGDEKADPAPSVPNAIEWNIEKVGASQAWDIYCGYGYYCKGHGITIGSIDTGTRWTHSALVNQYAGNGTPANHNFHWWDSSRVNGHNAVPFDYDSPGGHGTHTLGTALGDDGMGNQIGVAPEANWISSFGIDPPAGSNNANIISAMQFMLAPTDLNGNNANPALAPDVVSNSWGTLGTLNCADPQPANLQAMRQMIQAWVNADIFPSFSAGNDDQKGNGRPGSFIGNYNEAFPVGSLTRTGVKSSFSAIGPSCQNQISLDPIVMAYGGEFSSDDTQRIRSSSSSGDGNYYFMQGTSMAQPAVAGTVALMRQADSNLSVAQITAILRDTAKWDRAWNAISSPSNNYGNGVLQVDVAVQAALNSRSAAPGAPVLTPTPVPCETTPLSVDFEDGTLGGFQTTRDPNTNLDHWTVVLTNTKDINNSRLAFARDLPIVADQQLTSTQVAIPANALAATLSFVHSYNFELVYTPATNSYTAYDGGVLEVSVNNGAWADLGGNITTGGYVGPITSATNPLNGQTAWVGTSSYKPRPIANGQLRSFVPVVVDLMPYRGQNNMKFRWRLGTDDSNTFGGAIGWWIDDVKVSINVCPPTATPTRTPATPSNTPTITLTPTITPTPRCQGNQSLDYQTTTRTGMPIITANNDIGNHCDDCTSPITFVFPVTFYGTAFTSAIASANGNIQFVGANGYFYATCLPITSLSTSIMAYQGDLDTSNAGEGIFTDVIGTAPNRQYLVEWRTHYFGFGHPGTANFEVIFYENSLTVSVIYGATQDNGSGEVSGVQYGNGVRFTQFSCLTASLVSGLRVNYTLGACPTITPTPVPPTNTPTMTPVPLPSCGPGSNFGIATSAGAIVPGTDDTGNHGDDVVTSITLPFSFALYGTSFNTVNVSSNGNMQFGSANIAYSNNCLPDPTMGYMIAGHWDNLNTSSSFTCTGGCGIYTSVSGSAPNRIFNIEWRAVYYTPSTQQVNFEVRLYENDPTGRFDIVYGQVDQGGSSATVGVQNGSGPQFTQYECNTAGTLNPSLVIIFTQPSCGTPTTLTPTRTGTTVPPTSTPSVTPQAGNLVGHVTWQSIPQPNTRSMLPITLTLKLGTGLEINYPQQTTDASGFFTVPVSGLPTGPYTWRVQAPDGVNGGNTTPGFLASCGTVTLSGSPLSNMENGTMRGGDANNDNVVNTTDFSALKNEYGQSGPHRADFNNDNVVNSVDFNVMKGNFGQAGCAGALSPQGSK